MTSSDQLPLQLLDDLALSPSPYHAVARASGLLADAGFSAVSLHESFPEGPGKHFIVSGGSLVAWSQGAARPQSYCLVGAHTDSPNLRIRSNAEVASAGWAQLGVEVYGGALLNSWLDRDLGLAGRVMAKPSKTNGQPSEHLFLDNRPLLRIPQLAIHLDRSIREKGLKINPQQHLTPLWATGSDDPGTLAAFVADSLQLRGQEDIISWDLMAFDVQPPAIVGRDNDMLASARIDNLVSTFCGVRALIAAANTTEPDVQAPVLVLYDHEEVGSTSSVGAAGVFLASILERISAASGAQFPASGAEPRVSHLESMARSYSVSADGAHATNPNYVDKHEPNHQIALNKGVVIKRNANQRYATDASSEARFRAACERAGVPLQTYIHRNDIPCGSTIGPISAAGLSIPTVDVGVPQLAMHSVRELCGTTDIGYLFDALVAVWAT